MKIRMLALLVFLGLSCNAYGVTAFFEGKVQAFLLSDNARWGGCMIQVSVDLVGGGLTCPAGWVSLSCSGDFNTKDAAMRMYDAAQMAYALDKQVRVEVTDAEKNSGYCVVKRLDVF